MSESVRETIDRVMQQAGYYDHPYQVGERTFYVDDNSPFAQVKNDLNGLPQRINEWTQNYINNQQPLRVDTPQNNLQQYNQEALNNINQNLRQQVGSNWNGVFTSAVTGAADGIFGGTERATNGLTKGAYGYVVDQFVDNAYSNRQNRLQQYANQAGLGMANKVSNRLIDGSSILLGRGIK